MIYSTKHVLGLEPGNLKCSELPWESSDDLGMVGSSSKTLIKNLTFLSLKKLAGIQGELPKRLIP